MPLPNGIDPQAAAREVLRPAAHRLRRQVVDADAYVASWASHPGLRPVLRDVDPRLLRDIALHDAVPGRDGRLRCGVAEDAVAVDACDVAVAESADEALSTALARRVPVELVWARRGLMNEPHGLYDDDCVAGWTPAGVVSTRVEGANHLSVVLVDRGVRIIADVLLRMAGASRT